MKCPKCGYLGFETSDRCRNCQYDFSLSLSSSESELALHGAEHTREGGFDFELPPIARQPDTMSAAALDLDRLFGDAEPPQDDTNPARLDIPGGFDDRDSPAMALAAADEPADEIDLSDTQSNDNVTPASPRGNAFDSEPQPELRGVLPVDEGALPFDDVPLLPPPAARTPLAVRRSTPDIPRNRPRTTRPVRTDALDLESTPSQSGEASTAVTAASMLQIPSLGVRVGAGLVDLVLLATIDVVVLYLTLRVTGLQNSLEDIRTLSVVPFVGFLALLTFGYLAAFTVAGGQTIGKMALGLRVMGDDGRPVDAAGGMLRALGCMLVPVTLGVSYLPALFTSEQRALHDHLAGTRVVLSK